MVATDERGDEGTLGVGGVPSAGASDLADVRAAVPAPVEHLRRTNVASPTCDVSSVKGSLVFDSALPTIQLPSDLPSDLPSELPSELPSDLVRGFYLDEGVTDAKPTVGGGRDGISGASFGTGYVQMNPDCGGWVSSEVESPCGLHMIMSLTHGMIHLSSG